MTGPLKVDGRRPAVAWVSMLPADWLKPPERLVMLAIANDSYDGVTARPGYDDLGVWTGMHPSTVRNIVRDLCKPTDKRPALLRREEGKRQGHRVTLVLLKPRDSGALSEEGAEAQTAPFDPSNRAIDPSKPRDLDPQTAPLWRASLIPRDIPADSPPTPPQSPPIDPPAGEGGGDHEEMESDEEAEEGTSVMWFSHELAELRLHLDLARGDRGVIMQRMSQVPADLRLKLVEIAGRPPPRRGVDDPVRFVLARINKAQDYLARIDAYWNGNGRRGITLADNQGNE